MKARHGRSSLFLIVASTLCLRLAPMLASQTRASGHSPTSEEPPKTEEEALAMDSAALAAALDLSTDEVTKGVALTESVDRLREHLESAVAQYFYGIYVDWKPTFAVIVLSSSEGQAEVAHAIAGAVSEELAPYVTVTVSANSEAELVNAMDVIIDSIKTGFAHLDVDIRTGYVLVTATSADSMALLQDGIEALELPVPVLVVPPAADELGGDQNSYGGLLITSVISGINHVCTSGFSVTTTSFITGVADAAHCKEANSHISTSDGNHDLDFQDEQWAGNADVQWFTTIGTTDANKIQDGSGTRLITARVSRSSMDVGDTVCGYGQFGGHHCGTIASKNFNPTGSCFSPGHEFNSVFIRVNSSAAQDGDSGGPWFLAQAAYGIHKGETCDSDHDSVFTAQNYLSSVGVTVLTS